MILLPYIISSLIGYLVTAMLLKKTRYFNTSFHLCLSLGIGLGLSGLLTFLTFLLSNEFNKLVIIYLHIALLAVLFYMNRLLIKNHLSFSIPKFKTTFSYLNLFTWIVALITIFIFARHQIHGQWDGWAVWNLKMRFFILGEQNWKAVFTQFHWHTQPDYPVLLPMINVWSFAVSGKTLHAIPMFTSIFFTFGTYYLLFSALKLFITDKQALLASCLILFNPFVLFIATSQYADIVLSFFLLSSIILAIIAMKEKEAPLCLLLGLTLGIMTFVKNEGIVLAGLLALLTSGYLFFNQENDRSHNLKLIQQLFIGLVITACITIIFKLFIAPANKDILLNVSSQTPFFNIDSLRITLKMMGSKLIHMNWNLIWIFLMLMFATRLPEFIKQEKGIITLFFVFYMFIVIIVYLTTVNFSLLWRISRTADRIYLYLLPSVIFLCFYGYFSPKNNN